MRRQADDYQDQPFGELAYAEPAPVPQREPREPGGTMQGLAAMAIGVLTLIVVFIVIPLVGSPLQETVSPMIPSAGPGAQWNNSVNPNIPTGAGLWLTLSGVIKVAGVVVLFTGLLKAISGARG